MEYEEFKANSAQRLRQLRKEGGLTQEEMADRKISVRAYQKLENGKNGMSLKTIFLLSRRLGIHPEKFFGHSSVDKVSQNKQGDRHCQGYHPFLFK